MKKCIIWGTGDIFSKCINAIRYHEKCNKLILVGITSNGVSFERYLGYKFIAPQNISKIDFDYIIIAAQGQNVSSIKNDIIALGISKEKVLRYNAFLLPEFDFDKYINIYESRLTIFADNCWGGITYNRLGLEFNSPFINLYVKNDSYIKFLENPHLYINSTVTFKEMKYAPLVNKNYPLCECEDVELRFNHYDTFASAKDAWDRRRKRVNWDSVLYMMMTEDKKIADKFCNLPYERKICFVPFKTSEKCLYYVDFFERYNGPFWQAVVDMAKGLVFSYSVIDLVNGECKKLSVG